MHHFLQEDTLFSLFHVFIKPYIDYGGLNWGGTVNTHHLKLKQTLNKAMRVMAFRSMDQLNPCIFTTKYYYLQQT